MSENPRIYVELFRAYHAAPDVPEAALILERMAEAWYRMTWAEREAARSMTHWTGRPIPEESR